MASVDEAGGSRASTARRGDVPSILLRSDSTTDRAQGGKGNDDVNLSDLVHSILTSSSRSSDRNAVRDQVDELIRRHLKDGTEERVMDLSPSARMAAAALRLNSMETES
ncbi:hypothetical protein GCK32_012503 [Trichostrongylus colubriformis]|uniref:Uncharacterized protein n=1 Tax=Trichostrongylus colubriformis TaxID=6319 RepID=A0AAN8IF72_TRICO